MSEAASPERSSLNVEIVSGTTFDGVSFTVALDMARPIDNGATARIYKGEIPASQPLVVAVKVFGHILNDVQQELIVRELRAARQVSRSHRSILPFLGTVDVGHQTAIVSLYMRNGNLMEYIKAHMGCDKAKLVRQVAEAVDFIHTSKNLVHGDIKCANVLISDSGHALLTDFGLSTFIEQNQSTLATITAIRNMNTLRFAAPELLTGPIDSSMQQRSKTRESDVYAFGMLVLEAITENIPWHGLIDLAVLLRVSAGEHSPRPLDGPLVSMSHLAWELCLNCWRTCPTDRIRMTDVLFALNAKGFDVDPVRSIKIPGGVESIACMPSGRHIVSGSSRSGGIHIWDTCTGLSVAGPMQGPTLPICSMAVSPSGLQIASGSLDHTIRRWNPAPGTPIGDHIHPEVAPLCIAYSPDGRHLAYGENSCVRLRHADADGPTNGIKLRGDGYNGYWVTAIAFSPDGSRIASGSYGGVVCTWDVDVAAPNATLASLKLTNQVSSLAFSPDGARLAVAEVGQPLRIWSLASGRLDVELDKHHSYDTCYVAFSPAGDYLAGAVAGTVRIWDARTGRLIGVRRIGRLPGAVFLAFSPDGRSLVSSAENGETFMCDLFA